MDNWNKLLGLLDMTLGFPNKIRSDVKKKGQSFDQRTGEHVFVLEYRIKVNSGIQPPAPAVHRDPQPKTVIQSTAPGKPGGSMETIRELMDVKVRPQKWTHRPQYLSVSSRNLQRPRNL